MRPAIGESPRLLLLSLPVNPTPNKHNPAQPNSTHNRQKSKIKRNNQTEILQEKKRQPTLGRGSPTTSPNKSPPKTKTKKKTMASPSTPLPTASQALHPYIHPRPTVSQIRQSLHSHLERQLRLEAAQTLSLANIADPPLTQTLPDEPPASVTGVRAAYWRALRARQVAGERYEGLRAEVRVLAGGVGEGFGGGSGDGGDLLALLRARERRRRLGVVERAVDAVEREGKGVVGAKIDEVVRRAVGDVPVLPSQRGGGLGGGSGREEGELRMMELKKAILGAKATIDRLHGEDSSVDVRASGAGELFALQQARNELIGWIEQQLAIIGDAQADEGDDVLSPAKANGHEEDGHVASSEEIIQLYDRYLEARRTLLDTIQTRQDVSPLASAPDSPKPPRTSLQEEDAASTTATTLLPFIKPLLDTQATEQETIQQAAYARRQLSVADSSSERLLRRFADESHLVHPGASHGRDWARAGEEAGEATRGLVLARAKAGEKSSREAEVTLGKLKGFTAGLEKMS